MNGRKGIHDFHQHNGCLNVIKHDGKTFVVEKIDDTAHLGKEKSESGFTPDKANGK